MEAAVVVKDLIERERAVCAELARVLHVERDALTRFSAAAMTECVRRKEALQAELTVLARARRRAVRDLAATVEAAEAVPDDGRVTALLAHLPADVATELRTAVAGLRQGLLETRRLQRVNGALADASLRMVGDLLGAYRRLLPGTRYDRRATVTPGPTPDALDQRV
jgi:flagellar biosynthesis/type III secretory pathway chaperone